VRAAALAITVGIGTGLGGCATSGNPKDPIEGFNRGVFAFNETLDKAAIKPLAQGYEAVVPLPGRTGIANFFSNINDVVVALNSLLQGKFMDAASDLGRVLVNTTLGIGGLFDIASELGLEQHDEDFGQTLGRWGVGDGAYLVLPVFGPRTVRDAGGLVVDTVTNPLSYLDDVSTRNALLGARLISTRAQLLPADKAIDEASLDKYAYIRDAYLQRRRNLIFDGAPPREREESSALDEPWGTSPASSDAASVAADPVSATGNELSETTRVDPVLSEQPERSDKEAPQASAPPTSVVRFVSWRPN
jgi:phospholipid-binding lipoprotein MlaA